MGKFGPQRPSWSWRLQIGRFCVQEQSHSAHLGNLQRTVPRGILQYSEPCQLRLAHRPLDGLRSEWEPHLKCRTHHLHANNFPADSVCRETHLVSLASCEGCRMANSVVRNPLQILAGRLRQLQLLDLWPQSRAVVDASHQHQQHAPAVWQGELKFRVPVEHATENKMAGGDGGVEREAQQV